MNRILLDGVSVEDFRAMLKDEITEVLKDELVLHSEKHDEDELLTVEDSAKFLTITEPTLDKYTKDGQIDSYGVGDRRVVYKKTELLKFLRKREFNIKIV